MWYYTHPMVESRPGQLVEKVVKRIHEGVTYPGPDINKEHLYFESIKIYFHSAYAYLPDFRRTALWRDLTFQIGLNFTTDLEPKLDTEDPRVVAYETFIKFHASVPMSKIFM
jgi:hypothetical protein